MLHFASQEKTSLLCKNSVSTKNSPPAQSFINNSKIPKHIVPSAQSSIDIHTYPTVKEGESDYELVDIVQRNDFFSHINPSLTKPSNKAPPTG